MTSFSRRAFLRLVAAGGLTAVSPRQTRAQMGGPMGGRPPDSPLIAPFKVALPLAPVANPVRRDETTDYYELAMREAHVEIVPGTRTRIWGYDGITPGPTFRVHRDRRVVVRHYNELAEQTSVHLHGGHVAARFDGHPTAYIEPGGSKRYVYPNTQRPAALWYHDHTMDVTAPHVYRGLAGFYIIEDAYEAALALPSGEHDVPIVIQDRTFTADGALVYEGNFMGELGDTILANGAPYPFYEVGTRKLRLRLLNGSNARIYELALSSGMPFVQIGTDGGLLPAPIARRALTLAPGERADVVLDFGKVALGTRVVLQNLLGSQRTAQVMRFDVVRRENDDSRVPPMLRALRRLDASKAATTRTFVFSRGMGMGMGMTAPWMINGRAYDPRRVDARPRRGDTEIWRLVNRSMMHHPVHIHDIQWQILDVNGRPPEAGERGWKDTFLVPAMGTVRVIGRFTRFTGLYVFHCHILEHEDRGMMAQFEVV